ncbi:MAG: preprotein translocase subunit SecA [Bacteroidota bacterium]|jgi:preprotein translocase subunit SecA
MLDFITKSIASLFGTASQREVKALLPIVAQINAEFDKLKSISDDELRATSLNLQKEIQDYLVDIDKQLDELNKSANDTLETAKKEAIFSQIDKLELERNVKLEEVLMIILPRAFAVVKETSRRYAQNGKLVVTATEFDKEIARHKANVQVQGDTATWHNKWLAAGNEITWEMVHYDVQLIGGIVLHQGKIAEMATGEGKTLVATLPAFLNALAKKGVHVVTVNDYLAKRDSEWMAPLFEFHHITIDCIDKHEPNSEGRKNAYQADITYGTNNEFGFDYLRDNMARDTTDLVQRKHHYAMVDEVDSVLVDDARTPLIISGPMARGGEDFLFQELKPRVTKLVEAQRKLVGNYLVEAKKLIGEGNEKDGGLALFRAYRGLPKNKPLIKYLSEPGVKQILQKTENQYLQDNSREMPKADEPLYFVIDEKHNSIDLTVKGIDLITSDGDDARFFILPDIGTDMALIEKDERLTEEEKLQNTEKLISDYTEKSSRIHTVNQLLKAYCLFEKDTEYILVDGKVKIVDEQTGRVMEGRRYSDGLHQAIEAKENVKVEDSTQTYATVTLQNYFRMYHKLSGMTGTAETEASEFWEIYKLAVITIPTNRPTSRTDEQDKVYRSIREKFNAVADEIVALNEKGRPVLVGTTSVEISELLSRMLSMRKIKHNVLNAKHHQREAEIVQDAGKSGAVTIATNMAGRGTDIKLSPEAKAAGGLAILGTERHDSRRVDRQLRGRAGRQGDPGSSQFFVSLEDNLMRLFGSDRIASIMDRLGLEEGEVIQHSMITSSIERAQKKVEENNFGVRKRLLEYDDVMNKQREVIYKRRRNALFGDRLSLDILNIIYDTCDEIAQNAKHSNDFENLRFNTINIFGFSPEIQQEQFSKEKVEVVTKQLFREALKIYNQRKQENAAQCAHIANDLLARGTQFENVVIPFSDGKNGLNIYVNIEKAAANGGQEVNFAKEKFATLALIDQSWKEHLRDMDDLKQSVQNAVHEQKDPLLIYKMEAFKLFKTLVSQINEDILRFVFRGAMPEMNAEEVKAPPVQFQAPRPVLKEIHENYGSALSGGSDETEVADLPKQEPIIVDKGPGRNDKISVQYMDGTIKRDVKYKSVEEDLQSGKCIIVNFA